MPIVEERGELAVRGGILDLFPPQRARPVRVELLGNEVESIREFDAASQRSQQLLARRGRPPPREILLDRSLGDRAHRRASRSGRRGAHPARAVDELVDSLLRGHAPARRRSARAAAAARRSKASSTICPRTRWSWWTMPDGRARTPRPLRRRGASRTTTSPAPPGVWSRRRRTSARARGARARRRGPPPGAPRAPRGRGRRSAAVERYALRSYGHEELHRELLRARTTSGRSRRWSGALRSGSRATLARDAGRASSLSDAERLRALLASYGITARVAT